MGFFKKKPENKVESHAQNAAVLDGMMQHCYDTQAEAASNLIKVRDMMVQEAADIDTDIEAMLETKAQLEENIRLINAQVLGDECAAGGCTCDHCSCVE